MIEHFDLISIALLIAMGVGFVRLRLKEEIRFSHIMLLIAFSAIWVPFGEAIGGDRAKAGALAGLSLLYTLILMALSDQSDKLREERDNLLWLRDYDYEVQTQRFQELLSVHTEIVEDHLQLKEERDKLKEERAQLEKERDRLKIERDTLEKVAEKHHKRGD